MKFRKTFVANSSTSSYLMIGMDYVPESVMKQEGWILLYGDDPDCHFEYGAIFLRGTLVAVGSESYPEAIGIPIYDSVKMGVPFEKLRQDFSEEMNEQYGYSVDLDDVDILFGESGSG